MKKEKLNLKELNVSSFTTSHEIKGGAISTLCPTSDHRCTASEEMTVCVNEHTICVVS
ncbi:pinensin family lanthipeptide [Roseivirga sp. BDSF3-8]|uniref:pinensin family lanthipeptide n=1 Tax=Roseivirga sp. BDSF3-8 TaxID=3241598 RepID=UPI0035322F69